MARSKVKSRSHHESLHTSTPNQILPAARLPTHPDAMGENNTSTALKDCGVKLLLFLVNCNFNQINITIFLFILVKNEGY